MPLRNIFKISDIEDIGYRIDLIKKSDEKRQELEEALSENITKHINEVWKEHKIKIKIRIEENLNCKVSVEDKDNSLPKYKMNQRSDGFKQFISILLNLSEENKTNILKNKSF
jgi:AAA15 family ATPase/GTPase